MRYSPIWELAPDEILVTVFNRWINDRFCRSNFSYSCGGSELTSSNLSYSGGKFEFTSNEPAEQVY